MINNIQAIDSLIRDAVKRKNIMGASYSLISKDEISEHYIGFQGEYEDHIPLRPGMMYDLASLTKVVGVTTRIFQLLGEKIISLDDPIGKYVLNLNYPKVNIGQLLMHNSGLPADIENDHSMNKVELVMAIKSAKLINKPGEVVVYSDLGYILLGWLIKEIDGDLNESLKQHVFDPLEMTQTTYNPEPGNLKKFVPTEYQASRGGMIRGQVHDFKAYTLDGVSGHAGLFSTLEDLNKFVSMYLNNGRYHDKVIIDQSIIEMLTDYYQSGRTLAWKKWLPEGEKLWHTGFTGTSIAMDLRKKTGFICLTNRVYPDRSNSKWLDTRKLALSLFFNQSEKI